MEKNTQLGEGLMTSFVFSEVSVRMPLYSEITNTSNSSSITLRAPSPLLQRGSCGTAAYSSCYRTETG